jgi:hypothetical protein
MLKCCVDERKLEFCFECDNFVCERLNEWALQDPKYGEGVERLRWLKAGGRRASGSGSRPRQVESFLNAGARSGT